MFSGSFRLTFKGLICPRLRTTDLESSEKSAFMSPCLHWICLLACLWVIASVKSINVGRSKPLWLTPFPREVVVNYSLSGSIRLKTTKQPTEHTYIHFSLVLTGCDVSSYSNFLPPWLPCFEGYLELKAKKYTLSPELIFVSIFLSQPQKGK